MDLHILVFVTKFALHLKFPRVNQYSQSIKFVLKISNLELRVVRRLCTFFQKEFPSTRPTSVQV
jgi:hypothetical protein